MEIYLLQTHIALQSIELTGSFDAHTWRFVVLHREIHT